MKEGSGGYHPYPGPYDPATRDWVDERAAHHADNWLSGFGDPPLILSKMQLEWLVQGFYEAMREAEDRGRQSERDTIEAQAARIAELEAGDAGIAAMVRELVAIKAEAATLRAELDEAVEVVRGFLQCPEIADCAPRDKDPDTQVVERRARAFLAKHASGEKP